MTRISLLLGLVFGVLYAITSDGQPDGLFLMAFVFTFIGIVLFSLKAAEAGADVRDEDPPVLLPEEKR